MKKHRKNYIVAVSTVVKLPVTAYLEIEAKDKADSLKKAKRLFKNKVPSGWISALEQEAIGTIADEISIPNNTPIRLFAEGKASLFHSAKECKSCASLTPKHRTKKR